MPGRYSHSVVLAGYSSQGIINLPNDKHVEYLRHSPFVGPPRVKSNANIKSTSHPEPHQRSQSALAVRSGRWTPASDIPTSPARRWFIDDDSQQPSRSTSTVRNTPEPSSYRPRRSIDTPSTDRDLPPRSRSVIGTTSENVPQIPQRSAQRPTGESGSASHLVSTPPDRLIGSSNPTNQIRNRAANAAAALLQKAAERRESTGPRAHQPETKAISAFAEPARGERTRQGYLRQSTSNATMQTQIHEPIKEQEEPDFDGFSDANETSSSYFAQTSPVIRHPGVAPEPKRVEKASRAETTGSSSNIMSRSRQSYEQHVYAPSSPRSEHNTNGISEDSGSKLNSMSSLSSIDSSVAHSARRTTKSIEPKKSAIQPPIAQWGLPEIEEDGVFSPEIFAQDLDSDLEPHSSSPSFGESAFGMISSGRDVDFNADTETLSDAASACPPDIGRYRDEDDVAKPQPVSRLKSEDARAPSPSLAPVKSKKGFLSRLKSKSNWM